MNKLEAIEYLITNDISFDEWSEAGMWHAVKKVMRIENTDLLDIGEILTEEYLKKLLKNRRRYHN